MDNAVQVAARAPGADRASILTHIQGMLAPAPAPLLPAVPMNWDQ